MKYAYVTKRIAPDGYVAVTRKLAEVLYNEGYAVIICGSNVNEYHVFKGWCLGSTVVLCNTRGEDFTSFVSSFKFYLEPELGKYPVFYVRKEVIANMDLSILKEPSCTT